MECVIKFCGMCNLGELDLWQSLSNRFIVGKLHFLVAVMERESTHKIIMNIPTYNSNTTYDCVNFVLLSPFARIHWLVSVLVSALLKA